MPGDIPAEELRRALHRVADLVADYVGGVGDYPVAPPVEPGEVRAAFSLVPEYLATSEKGVTNLMDFGFQLGRRFRALKLWMVTRRFGVEGIREAIREKAYELAAIG